MTRMLPRFRAVALVATLLATAVIAVAPAAFAATISLTDSGFEPRESSVAAGETVVWTNNTDRRQTIVGTDGSWDSGPLGAGETFSVQLRQPGTIGFRTADGSATGSLKVAAAADSAQGEVVVDPNEPALPITGMPIFALLSLAAGLVAAGYFMVRRAETPA